jgi:hypothetical protein
MIITRQDVATRFLQYLQNKITLDQLVDWSENAMLSGEFEDQNYEIIREIVAKLGLADVKQFGITWDDCEDIISKLGYTLKIDAQLVA